MNILEKIIKHKKSEVAERKSLYPVKLLERSIYFETPVVSLNEYLLRDDKAGIIAEIKRRSPSEGDINPYIDVEQLSIGYMQAGASALSVLTDQDFFGGSNEDLTIARKFNFCPILRKDFIIDDYQLIEARSIGADAVLLIASALDADVCNGLARLARELGLEVLLEVHSAAEVKSHLNEHVTAVGVNNRNLGTFEVRLETSLEISEILPADIVRVSESGISDARAVKQLTLAGFNGFLIGTHFMRHADPQDACARLVKEIMTARHKTEVLT